VAKVEKDAMAYRSNSTMLDQTRDRLFAMADEGTQLASRLSGAGGAPLSASQIELVTSVWAGAVKEATQSVRAAYLVNDSAWLEAARNELDRLLRELSSITGVGGEVR
jgi:hypothetical protein